MKPFLESLPTDRAREEFEQAVLTEAREQYTPQRDEPILYPFKRLFFILHKTRGSR